MVIVMRMQALIMLVLSSETSNKMTTTYCLLILAPHDLNNLEYGRTTNKE
jgi:hypothetical protein